MPKRELPSRRRLAAAIAWLAVAVQPTAAHDAGAATEPTADRPNVLFVSIDDLNDWVGVLEGHPDARTPNIDRLAERSVVFSNAYCTSPLCNPSRAAVFSGRLPTATGVYTNSDGDVRKARPDLKLLPTVFRDNGYATFGAGKLLHQSSRALFEEGFFPHLRWSPFDPRQVKYEADELPRKGTEAQSHEATLAGRTVSLPLNGMPSDRNPESDRGESFDWGALPVDDAAMGDGKLTDWGADLLRREHDRPFFMAIGYYRPHIPLFAPERYFELIGAAERIPLPPFNREDLDDLGPYARRTALEADTAGAHRTVVEHGQWREAVKAYLACIAFIDAQVGELLDALDEGPNGRDTIVVLWSDHGWHLGEKQHWGKWTLWERSLHVPLMVALPGQPEHARGRREEAVSLVDLYPTLVDLCGLTDAPEQLDGQSLAPLLGRGALADSEERVALSMMRAGDYSLIDPPWHYIRYNDGSEELYDWRTDKNEWRNLAGERSYNSELERMREQLRDLSERTALEGVERAKRLASD
ncbi:sulfatase [Botrimarina sp.]|uniref:sulfatase n=1 Tax=Botrimarina sp. TaxID=2795802 RepID=UPI0032ECCFBE